MLNTTTEPTIDTSGLTAKLLDYWEMIFERKGVVMLRGKAGIAKSATCQFIADNVIYNGKPLRYVDLRLSQMDETHFGFPYRKMSEKFGFEVMDFALPKFFEDAMTEPVLINFEELNRCSQDVQNAALELLNERTLHGRKLPDHVFMVATGNMGEEDGCHVQQFDNALVNRLILIDYTLPYEEWCADFANKNVINYVVDFLAENTTTHYYSQRAYLESNEGKPFASARSWTNLSEPLLLLDNNLSEIMSFVKEDGQSYVGDFSANAFYEWMKDLQNITLAKIKDGTLHTKYIQKEILVKRLSEIKKSKLNLKDMTEQEQANVNALFEKYKI